MGADTDLYHVAVKRIAPLAPTVITNGNGRLALVLVNVLVAFCRRVGVAATDALIKNADAVTNRQRVVAERVVVARTAYA